MKLFRIILPIIMIASTFLHLDILNGTIVKQLEADKTYDSYDFNGDGQKDVFKIELSTSSMGDAYFYLNDTKSTIFVGYGADVYYYRHSKSDEYLIVNYLIVSGTVIDIYKFSGDSAERVQSLDGGFYCNDIDNISGKNLSILTGPNHSHQMRSLKQAMDNGGGEAIRFIKTYELDTKLHVFVSSSPYMIPNKEWIITLTSVSDKRRLNTSSECFEENQLGILLVEGEQYTLKKAFVFSSIDASGNNKQTVRMQLMDSDGRIGWITSSPDWVFS